LLHCKPVPVQVAAVKDRVFLVNASLGLYPDLLEDREAFKARFGRSRWVAFWAACTTLLRAQRRLRVHIEMGNAVRDLQALTLFVGNNRLQLQQLGAEPQDTVRRNTWPWQRGRTDAQTHRHAAHGWVAAPWCDGAAWRGRRNRAL